MEELRWVVGVCKNLGALVGQSHQLLLTLVLRCGAGLAKPLSALMRQSS